MILGLDHLAVSVRDVEAAAREHEAAGYRRAFLCRDVVNHAAKRPFLSHYQERHDICLLRPARGPGLELTDHGVIDAGGAGPYRLADGTIVLDSLEPDADARFFAAALGFTAGAGRALSLRAPIPAWSCELRVEPAARSPGAGLAAPGHPCLAFISNALEADRRRLQDAAAREMTEPFSIVVNAKTLSIILCRSPSGALCELIQPLKP